ncbi:MAG: calcineurin-like phosphoesterase C-terminal domain-containing protein [Bacteroidales bacterium]|nr:calcineurin-like phosphoesterase C-terminal domain-containing protein [Bacteroidales bacterium]
MNRSFRIFLLASAAIAAGACGSPERTETEDPGTVISEINGTLIDSSCNAVGLVYDSTSGKGIPGVAVSDGYKYVLTDGNGVYQMPANSYSRMVYLSIPAEYEIPVDEHHHPLFFSPQGISHSRQTRNDFALTPRAVPVENFTLVGISDPQCNTAEKVRRYCTETISDIVSTLDGYTDGEVVAITLGDIVHDSVEMWPDMYSSMSDVGLSGGRYIPFFQTIGNHDHYASADSEYSAVQNFMDTFGPTDYSFNIGKAHIVSMDNVQVTKSNGKSWSYYIGYTDKQYRWLQEDFATVEDKSDKILIFCGHGPFRRGGASGSGGDVNVDAHYSDFLKLFTQFKEVHLLIGHRHFSQMWVHTDYASAGNLPIYEHIESAACGAFWLSNSNLDGAPNGYTIYSVHGNRMYDWVQKGTGRDIDDQMTVYNGNQEYTGSKSYPYVWYEGRTGGSSNIPSYGNSVLKGCFVASIWGADNRYWKVALYQNGVKVGDLQRISSENSQSNACVTSYYFNELGLNHSDYSIGTSHYWYIKAPSGYPNSEKNWEIRATQTIPGSGVEHTYVCSKMTLDYEGI